MKTGTKENYLSVVIPCYNEEKNLAKGRLGEVHAWLSEQSYDWEVIVVNDGSTDLSRDLVSRFIQGREHFFLLDIPHGGKPQAVWAGLQCSKGRFVLFTDMDQSSPIGEADKLIPWLEKGFDMVIGSRGAQREGFSFLRKTGSRIFRRLRQAILLSEILDTQCGFKICRREAGLAVFPKLHYLKRTRAPKGWKVSAFDVELLYLFENLGYRIKEVEVAWSHCYITDTKCRDIELSRYVRESVEMAGEVARVKWNEITGKYRRVKK